MTDQELAGQLLHVVAPDNETLARLVETSDALSLVLELVEIAAIDRTPIPRELFDEVQELADHGGGGVDDADIVALREDLAILSPLAHSV